MPWEHCDQPKIPDSQQTCPTCGTTKTAWTVELNKTRTLVLERRAKRRKPEAWIEFCLLGRPLEAYELEGPDGQGYPGKLDEEGRARHQGLYPGECRLRFKGSPSLQVTSERTQDAEGWWLVPTDELHTFQVSESSTAEVVRLVLRDSLGAPLPNLEYEAEVSGQASIKGTSSPEGLLELEVPTGVDTVLLHVLGGTFTLAVGELDSVSQVRGVQQRLNNLGFGAGAVDDDPREKTRDALLRFQESVDLPPTGYLNAATRRKLEEIHSGETSEDEGDDEEAVEVEVEELDAWEGQNDPGPLPAKVLDLEDEDE